MIKFSFVVPVYNRPDEVRELLDSFESIATERSDYEIILVEDGSTDRCEAIAAGFGRLPIRYHFQSNTGPGPARNAGAKLATGQWLIFLDSDTLLSAGYFEALSGLEGLHGLDYFGGPDANHTSFTLIQRAIGYSMTSFLSTGGIRGKVGSLEMFKPRSFNMGVRRSVFEAVGGFSGLRFGEDMDLSIRLERAGYQGRLIPEAIVYHKRRSTFKQFFKQVFNSGMARVVLARLHAGSLRPVHLLPVAFVLYHVVLLLMSWVYPPAGWGLLLYPVLYLSVATLSNRSLQVGILAVIAVYVQLFGYGMGFLKAAWDQYVLRRPVRYAFRDNFYQG